MRSGKLDNVIEIQRESLVDDGFGNQVPGGPPVTIATLRAQVISESTEEFIRNYGASTERVKIFRTRWAEGFTLSDVVLHDGRIHNLKEIKPIGRRRGLELRCVSTGA